MYKPVGVGSPKPDAKSRALLQRVSSLLLCSTVIASPAFAVAKKGVSSHHGVRHTSATKKSAVTSAAATAPRAVAQPRRNAPRSMQAKGGAEAVMAMGHRYISHGTNQVVSRATMEHFVTGTNPMQILAQSVPGVSFQSSDALGLDSVASTLYMRGFNQTQLGVSLDGIPMGAQGFHNWYGLNVDQMAIQETISSITASQGAGALSVPSSQTLGGAITFTSTDPKDRLGGEVSQMFGSNHMFRTYGRVDSGILNSSGTKFFAAYARTDQNLWKGYGNQEEQQANFKLVQPLRDKGKISAVFDYSNFSQYNYLGMTKNMWQQMGRDAIYQKPDYAKSIAWANYAQNGGVPAEWAGRLTNDEVGDVTYDGTQVQRNYLSAISMDYELFKNVTSHTVAYGHVSNGLYQGTNNFMTSPDGTPLVDEAGHPDVRRLGFTQSFDIKLHNNDIQTGVWYENNRFRYPMRLYADTAAGPHASINGYKASQATTLWSDSFNTNTFQFFLQDTWTIIPGMTLLGGFRSMTQTTHGGTEYDNVNSLTEQGVWGVYYQHPANGSLTASSAFLPHFNFDYHFLKHHEFYWDIAENMRAYDYAAQNSSGSPWGGLGTSSYSGQQVFDDNKTKLRPERTWNYIVGYRYNSEFFTGSADFYHTDYYNRLAAITTGPSQNAYSAYENVGRETMNGADVAGTIRPVKGLEISNSFSWNDATYQTSNLPYNGSTISLKGKHQVFYPKFMYTANLTYTWRHATFNFNTSYLSARPITYTNDVKVPSYWSSTLMASYDFGQIGMMHALKATFMVNNLFNQNYIGGVYGAAAVSGDDNAILFQAPPRQFYGTLSAQF